MYSCFVLALVEEESRLDCSLVAAAAAAAASGSSENGADEPEGAKEEEARAPRSRLLDWTRKLGNLARALLEIFVKRVCSERDSGHRGMSMHP